MRRIKAYSGPLFLSIFLLASTALHAQAPAAGTTVSVKMIDTVNSGSDPAGRQYRASVTKAVTAANGIAIAQGAAATITLTSSGSNYAAQLSSFTINGQQVAVTSNSATVSSTTQVAQEKAASAVSSVLGGLGHHVSAPAAVAAAATGQHVSLPTGTTLTFVLGASPAAPAAPSTHTMTASTGPAPAPASSPAASSGVSVSSGITTLVVCYSNQSPYPSDPNNKTLYLSAAFEALADRYGDATLAFSNYLKATYNDALGVKCLPMFTTDGVRDAQKQLAGFATKLKAIDTGWGLSQPARAQGQSGFDPLATGPGGVDLTQHRLTTYMCTLDIPGGTTIVQPQPYNAEIATRYLSPVFQADWNSAPVSMAYNVFIRDHYVHDLNPTADLSPRCSAQSPAMLAMQHQSALIGTKLIRHVVQVDFTDTAAEATAAANASAAQAAAAPTAAANEKYVYCLSGSTGPVTYFSDIFAAVPTSPTTGPHAGRNGFPEFSGPFLAFLQNKYGFKSDSNSPPMCRAIYNPNPAGLQAAQATRQAAEDLAKQSNRQVVETGWKNQ